MDIAGERTLRDLLEEKAERHPEKVCLVFEDRAGAVEEFTYARFNALVDRLASGLSRLGVSPGDKVNVHLPNSPEILLTWFALGKLGAVMVPSNTASTGPEMLHVVNYSDATAVVTHADFLGMFREILPKCKAVRQVVVARGERPEPGTVPFRELLAAGGEPPRPPVRSDDVVQMIFTSGTTARPKGVLLTHANCLRAGERESKAVALQPEDRCLTALPAFHVNAQCLTILSALTVGGTCILIEAYSASRFWEQIRRHRATQTSLVAALLRTILAQPPAPTDRDHALRRVFFAINVTDKEKEDFERRFGVELINGYGLSEAMTVVTMAPVFGPKRWPSIGLPVIDRQVRIVDESGRELPPGEIGEIVVYGWPGRTLMKGYYKDPEATAQALRDGWLHTGDNGYMDEKGYVYFFDRKKDVIKRAAENVSASEVERVLVDHPLIAEAAVIGVPDPIKDEAVKAFVVLRPGASLTEADIIEYCKREMAKFKVPSFVEILESLPKTSIGKIEKKVLRAREAERRDGGRS